MLDRSAEWIIKRPCVFACLNQQVLGEFLISYAIIWRRVVFQKPFGTLKHRFCLIDISSSAQIDLTMAWLTLLGGKGTKQLVSSSGK